MREKGWEERGPKKHSKNSDFGTPLVWALFSGRPRTGFSGLQPEIGKLGVQTPVGVFSTQFLRKQLVFCPTVAFSRFSGAWSRTWEKQNCRSSVDMSLRYLTLCDALDKPTRLWTPKEKYWFCPPLEKRKTEPKKSESCSKIASWGHFSYFSAHFVLFSRGGQNHIILIFFPYFGSEA